MATQSLLAKFEIFYESPRVRVLRRATAIGVTATGLELARRGVQPDVYAVRSAVRTDVKNGIVSYDEGLARCKQVGLDEKECFQGCTFIPKVRKRMPPFGYINIFNLFNTTSSFKINSLVSNVPSVVWIFVGTSTIYFIGEVTVTKLGWDKTPAFQAIKKFLQSDFEVSARKKVEKFEKNQANQQKQLDNFEKKLSEIYESQAKIHRKLDLLLD